MLRWISFPIWGSGDNAGFLTKDEGALGMKVKLGVILDAIEMADDNYTYFLDLETGERVFLADELITGMDNEGLADEIEENPERYLRLPTKFEIHEYHIMEEFIWTLKGEKADKLECAIRGRGAFRRFKDMVNRIGISQQMLSADSGSNSSGMIFRQSITGNWRLTGAGSRGWSMRRGACEN